MPHPVDANAKVFAYVDRLAGRVEAAFGWMPLSVAVFFVSALIVFYLFAARFSYHRLHRGEARHRRRQTNCFSSDALATT
jgi:hypothetical protein